MTHAYQEIYLSNAQAALGELSTSVRVAAYREKILLKLFTVSSVSKHMENGEPAYLAGKSGIELAAQILAETTGMTEQPEQPERYARSCEYWIGWAVAYYQWYSGRKYSEIFEVLSFAELEKMYYTLHEADVSKFAEIADARIREHFAETNLKRIRTAYGCSQAELAKKSGVGLRSIQLYEQRQKDINKASAESLYKISRVLGCAMEDLLER